MKKFMCSFLLLLLSPLAATAQETDFRDVVWGMSKAQVMEIEKAELEEDNGYIISYDVGPGNLPFHPGRQTCHGNL